MSGTCEALGIIRASRLAGVAETSAVSCFFSPVVFDAPPLCIVMWFWGPHWTTAGRALRLASGEGVGGGAEGMVAARPTAVCTSRGSRAIRPSVRLNLGLFVE